MHLFSLMQQYNVILKNFEIIYFGKEVKRILCILDDLSGHINNKKRN